MQSFFIFNSHILHSKFIIEKYEGVEPLPLYLKKYYQANKNCGSKDRKIITSIVFNYYRLFSFFNAIEINESILFCIYLSSNVPQKLLPNHLNEKINLSTNAKWDYISKQLNKKESAINTFISDKVNIIDWEKSYQNIPYVFARLRPKKSQETITFLKSLNYNFEIIDNNTLSFSDKENLKDLKILNKQIVIQDKNSQKVLTALPQNIMPINSNINVWDCCAASGGKSILCYDIFEGKINLTASDIRENILYNYKQRLKEAQIKVNKTLVIDCSKPIKTINDQFDIIIADVPCTGSGTWNRSPENLYFFDTNHIKKFENLQYSIIKNIYPFLKNNGIIIYITCSIFKIENELQVKKIITGFDLEIIYQNYFDGCLQNSDSMFVSYLKKK